jgi:HEAT repeat protein
MNRQRRIALALFAGIVLAGGYLAVTRSYRTSAAYLLERLHLGTPEERAEAARKLGELRSEAERIVPELAQLLKDPNPRVRTGAAEGLDRMGPEARRAAPELTRALEGEDGGFLGRVLSALKKIGATDETVEALPRIAELTESEDPLVRLEASGALEAIGAHAERSLPTLLKVLNNRLVPDAVRLRVADTLIALGRRHPDIAAKVLAAAEQLPEDDGRLKARLRTALEGEAGPPLGAEVR